VLERWTEDAIDPSGVESKLGETYLQFGNVITALIGAGQVEQSLAELPAGFYQA
jgi:hypothetical protein